MRTMTNEQILEMLKRETPTAVAHAAGLSRSRVRAIGERGTAKVKRGGDRAKCGPEGRRRRLYSQNKDAA